MKPTEGKTYHGTVDSAGRILLPAELRGSLNLPQGTRVVIEANNGSVRLTPLTQVIHEVQDYFCQFKKPGESVVDELLEDRRQEAARENDE